MNSLAAKALVVDDQSMITMLIEEILVARGYEVIVAHSREQLDAALKLDRWALVVIDTDFATFAEMQSWRADRIVLCSGRSADVLNAEYPHMACLLKPFSEKDFDAILRGQP